MENLESSLVNNSNKKRKNGVSVFYFVFLFLAFFVTCLSISIAFFTASSKSELLHEIESAVVNFSLNVEKVNKDSVDGMIPVKDSLINSSILGNNDVYCVDKNGDQVCQIYKINITNKSDYGAVFEGNLDLIAADNSNYSNLKWAFVDFYAEPKIYGDINSMQNNVLYESCLVAKNTTYSFYIVVWISDNGVPQNNTDYGDFTGNVVFTAVSGDKLTSTFTDK